MRASSSARVPVSVVLAAVGAVVVLVGALGLAYHLRAQTAVVSVGATQSTAETDTCTDGQCTTIAKQVVGTVAVSLLANGNGTVGQLYINDPHGPNTVDLSITGLGVKVDKSSLQCVSGVATACLVSGSGNSTRVGEIFVARANGWHSLGKTFASSDNAMELTAFADSKEQILASLQQVSAAAHNVQVFSLSGDEIGCSKSYATALTLPELKIKQSNLVSCP